MELAERIVVVTGAASGIGYALAERLQQSGSKVLGADINQEGLEKAAKKIGISTHLVDVTSEQSIINLIEYTQSQLGPIDLFCSNAGIGTKGGPEVDNDQWQKIWEVNLMSHVWAARHLLPQMLERGHGYFMNTASAAGLLSQIGSAPYAVTKHAAVAFAEWMAITYGARGIKVSVLCPQAVRTAMTADNQDGVASIDGMIEPEKVADCCLSALQNEEFLILPHPEVKEYIQRKGSDYARWIQGMQKLQERYMS